MICLKSYEDILVFSIFIKCVRKFNILSLGRFKLRNIISDLNGLFFNINY